MNKPRRARHAAPRKSIGENKSGENSSRKKNSKKNKVRRRRTALLVFVIFIAVVGICIGCDFTKMGDDISDNAVAPLDIKDGKINVLLLGVDIEGLRTDAIMVASYDINENKVNLLSIPRDTRMYVGTRYQKINAAHAIGGMTGKIAGPEGSAEAVTRLTGIPIHYYLEFSFGAIDNFINALGGVDFEVPDVEGKGRGMNYDDPVQSLHIHLKPGMQHLNGNQVQQLLRYRKSNTEGVGYADGDRGRVEMQQKFLRALVDQKLTAANLLKIPEIITSIKEGIKTNMTVGDMTKYAKYLKNFSSENITAYQLPGEGKSMKEGTNKKATSYWICDLEETKTLVETVFGYDASKITIDAPEGSSKAKTDKSDKDSKSESSKSDKSEPASKTAKPEKETEKEVHEEIPDNSDEEDYETQTVKRTNPPLPEKNTDKDTVVSKNDSDKSDKGSTAVKTPKPKEETEKKDTSKDISSEEKKTDVKDDDKKPADNSEKDNTGKEDKDSADKSESSSKIDISGNSGSDKSDSESEKSDSKVINLD